VTLPEKQRSNPLKRVLNIAHRGFTSRYPDNTLEAFEAAIGINVDAIECDVRETADKRFVIFHDPQISGQDIGSLPLAEIREFRLEDRYRIPTLEETLRLCRNRVKLNIELKEISSLTLFLEVLRAGSSPDEVFLTSFNRDLIIEMAHLAPDIRRGIITALPVDDNITLARETKSDMIIVMYPFVAADLLSRAHAAELPVFVWGFPDMEQVRNALGMGVDGLVTDFPDEVGKELDILH